jgi:hypothetical protein
LGMKGMSFYLSQDWVNTCFQWLYIRDTTFYFCV